MQQLIRKCPPEFMRVTELMKLYRCVEVEVPLTAPRRDTLITRATCNYDTSHGALYSFPPGHWRVARLLKCSSSLSGASLHPCIRGHTTKLVPIQLSLGFVQLHWAQILSYWHVKYCQKLLGSSYLIILIATPLTLVNPYFWHPTSVIFLNLYRDLVSFPYSSLEQLLYNH